MPIAFTRKFCYRTTAAAVTVALASFFTSQASFASTTPTTPVALTSALKLTPAGTYHLEVPADVEWYSTGLVVGRGDVLHVTATGEWSYAPGQWSGPDGVPVAGWFQQQNHSLIAQVGGGFSFGVGTNLRWTVAAPTGVLYMGMADDNFANNFGQLSVTVTITTLQVTVNGFTVSNGSGPYQVAERQMLAKVPGAMALPSSGTPMAYLYPLAADQGQNNMWTSIKWAIAPTAAFLSEDGVARVASAKKVTQSLVSLLNQTYTAYVTQLQADRLPQTSGDFAQRWWVDLQSLSTTGETMYFQVGAQQPSSTPVETWSGLPTLPPGQGALAPFALSVVLGFSAAAPTPTTSTS